MRVVTATALVGLFVMTASAAAPVAAGEGAPQQAIVVFHDNVDNLAEAAAQLTSAHGGQVGFVYQHALKGFSATLPSRALAAIERDPRVAYVEADQLAHIAADTSTVPVPTGIDRINADQNANLDIDGNDDLRVDTVVAVIDTGIDFQHTDLNVNTAASVDCSGGSPLFASCSTGAGDDDNGHGTHVAGTIGALDDGPNYTGSIYTDVHVVGVAPGVEQWAIKVLRSDGSGYISWIVAGIDYVTANAPANGGPVTVANMSLGCECSSAAMDDAISKSVAAGVTYAVAAGNSAKDASTFSPANHPDVITVSALADFDGEPGALGGPTCRDDEDDTLANFSNFGSLVEVTAPGVCILSAWNDGGYNIISGTSMASPHAAGAAALLAASGVTDPVTIRNTLISTGNTTDWTDDSGDGITEPRVDVADETVYKPAMTGTDTGGSGNTAPVANDVSASGDEDTTISWTPSVSDADGDALSCSIATQPANGSATVALDCSSGAYTPNANYNGSDSFTYRVSDGSVSDDGTVSVTINPVNDAPVANDDSYSTATNTQLSVAAPGVLGNDSDVDGDSLSVSAADSTTTQGGAVTVNSDGSFTYDPPAGFTGTDTFGYTVSDPSGATDTGTVTINVGSATTMHVADLDGVAVNQGSTWRAEVTILVKDDLGNPVADATVSGTWTQSGTGATTSCVTGSDGTCSVSSGSIHKRNSSTTWSVSGITHGSLSYDSSANSDPDGDSDGTSITVAKP